MAILIKEGAFFIFQQYFYALKIEIGIVQFLV